VEVLNSEQASGGHLMPQHANLQQFTSFVYNDKIRKVSVLYGHFKLNIKQVHFHWSHMFSYERLQLAPDMKFILEQQATLP
jgi:hypothetical protein